MQIRFRSKDDARKAVWDALTEQRAARFPFPVHGRIPNFAGAREAAERLFSLKTLQKAKLIKVNPDSPQRYVREEALRCGITLFMPTPRLRAGFRKFDPRQIPDECISEAARLKTANKWSVEVPLDKLPVLDLIVTGSVAVTRKGYRCGKGHGYGDLEYGILRELGHRAVPVATTVHPLQIVEHFPPHEHDLPVSLIATPEEVIEVHNPPDPPAGIDWSLLSDQDFNNMPVLKELRQLADKR